MDPALLSPPPSGEIPLSPTLVSSVPSSPRVAPTRTVAIIKPHALDHRFDIEHRITEASFEVRVPAPDIAPEILMMSRATDRKGAPDGVRCRVGPGHAVRTLWRRRTRFRRVSPVNIRIRPGGLV